MTFLRGRSSRSRLVGLVVLVVLLGAAALVGSGAVQSASAAPASPSRSQDDFHIHLVSPADGTQIAWSQGIQVTFNWETNFYCTGSGCPIKLAIATDPGISQTVFDQQIGNPCTFGSCPTQATVVNLLPGTYYWHVYANYTGGSIFSETWSFTLTGTAPPTITGFSPTSGGAGTGVTITGKGFTGATAVKFNGTSATFNVSGDTQITTTVPNGATSGPISVTNAGGTTTSTGAFTVSSPPPPPPPSPPPPPPPTKGKPVLKDWFVTKGGPHAGSTFSILLNIVNSNTRNVARGGRVTCSAHIGTTLLVPVLAKFVSALDGYQCTWRLPTDTVGMRLTARTIVRFAASKTTVADPLYRARIGAPAGGKLVLIGPPAHPTPDAGAKFQASQSARIQFAGGAQEPIDWKAKGSFATCGGTVHGKVELFSTGIRCTWAIPASARGNTLTFLMTIHTIGQTKSAQFSAVAR